MSRMYRAGSLGGLSLLLLLLTSLPVAAQRETGTIRTAQGTSATCTTSGSGQSCVRTNVPGGVGSVTVQVVGSGTYTLQFEVSSDGGATWYQPGGVNLSSYARESATTGSGRWGFSNAGITHVQVRASAYTNGTPQVALTGGAGGIIAPLSAGSISGGNDAAGTIGAAVPGSGSYTALNIGGNLTGQTGFAVGSARPAAVAIVDGSGAHITSFGGGIQYTEGDTDATITGTAAMWEDTGNTLRATSAAFPLPVGDAGGSLTVDNDGTFAVQAAQSGTWNITNISGTVSLPTGAATAANQATANGLLTTIDADTGALAATTATIAATPLVRVGIFDAANTQITTFGGGTQYTEDDAAAANPVAPALTLIRADTPGAVTTTNGDNVALRGTNFGAAFVQVVDSSGAFVDAFGGSGGTAQNDNSAVTTITGIGALYDTTPPTITDGNVGLPRMDSNRYLQVTFPTAQTITATNLDVQSGGGDLALESGGNLAAAATSLGLLDNAVAGNELQVDCVSGCGGGTTDTDDGSIAGAQTVGLTAALNMVWSGSAWVRATAADATFDQTALTTGPQGMARFKDFDGSALPGAADTEGDATQIAASAVGVQYMMLVSEDGSLQYGTATTPLVVGDGSGALNVIVDSGAITVSATNLDVQSGGADLATEATLAGVLTSTNFAAAFGTAGSADSQVMSVQGIASMTPLQVQSNAANLATETTAGSALTALQLLDNAAFADEATFTYASSGVRAIGLAAESTTDTLSDGQVGIPLMTLDRIPYATPVPTANTSQAASECAIVSAASTNATNCKNAAGNVYGLDIINTTTTVYYLRMYNTSSAPTCSSATGFIRSIPIPPAGAAGQAGGIVRVSPIPVGYATGISYCLTGGSSSTDNTNAATGIFGAILYK